MTAEDELEQPSGSGPSSMLALRKTLSLVTPSCMSIDAWLAVSGACVAVAHPRYLLGVTVEPHVWINHYTELLQLWWKVFDGPVKLLPVPQNRK